MIKLLCGPQHDVREFNFSLPSYDLNLPAANLYYRLNKIKQNYRIGVLVSGGLDSALLYYVLQKSNQMINSKFTITPYTVKRVDGSYKYALNTINYINDIFGIPNTDLNLVGDISLEERLQVDSGVKDVLKDNDFVYVGIIDARPEHLIGWFQFEFKETLRLKYPLMHLQKSHIIDIIIQNKLYELFPLTHTCNIDIPKPCGSCNGCRERFWGFSELGLTEDEIDLKLQKRS
jgi:hypothetical protein